MRSDSTWTYFLTDHLGSIVAITDSTSAAISQTRYTEFGEVRTDVGSITETDYWYTYQQNITGSGLLDYNARMYDPSLGRFTQPDSLVPDPASPIGFNRYAYVNNSPINFTDPSGYAAITISGNDEYEYDEDWAIDTAIIAKENAPDENIIEIYQRGLLCEMSNLCFTMGEIGQIEDERNNKKVNDEPDYSYYETQGSNNLVSFYEAANYLKWWKPIPLVSEVITGWNQFNQDKEKNYSWDVQVSRVLIVIGEDFIIDSIATSAAGLSIALFSESGPGAIVEGFITYYSIIVLSDPFINPINENFVFPFFNVDD